MVGNCSTLQSLISLVLDTSTLMNCVDKLEDNMVTYKYVIPSTVASELDHLKESGDPYRSSKARAGLRFLEAYEGEISYTISDFCSDKLPQDYDSVNNNDNKIISVALDNDMAISTYDRGMKIKAEALGIKTIQFNGESSKAYKGYKELLLNLNDEEDNDRLANFYSNPEDNELNMLTNEYLIIKDMNKPLRDENAEVIDYQNIDALRFDGSKFIQIYKSGLKSHMFGNLKGKDPLQDSAIDSFMHNQITMIKGKAGTGKSLLTLGYAVKMIETNKCDKLIVFCNTVASKDSAKLGFYPGTKDEKLLDSSVGGMLASKFGHKSQVEAWIDQGKLQLIPFSDIRGWDGTGTNSIIWISEAQNLSISLMKLGLQRVGEDCKVIIDGDFTTQIDMCQFEGSNNGMRRASEIFRGENCYGEVELEHIYRSKVAKIADSM